MTDRMHHGGTTTVLVALSLIAAGLAGGGALLASGEEKLLREAAKLATESPLAASVYEEPAADPASWEVAGPKPAPHVTEPGVIDAGTGADLAVHRAVQFLMTQGCIEEGRRIVALLARGLVRVGPGGPGFEGIAVPRHCAELTPAEEADAQRGLPRTVTLARALLVGLWALPPERVDGTVIGPRPGPIAAWTRTLETMTSWVRQATRAVEDTAKAGGDEHMPAWHALVLVEAMRAALRDYSDLGWCNDGRGESWDALSATLARTRVLLKKKLGPPEHAG